MTAMKFKVGDTVKVLQPEGSMISLVGKTGKVLRVSKGIVSVEVFDWYEGHSCNGLAKAICGYNFFEPTSQLQVVKPVKAAAPRNAVPTAKKPTQEYKGNGKHTWETVVESVDSNPKIERLRVPGGWLYKPRHNAAVFVPMPEVVKHKV